MQNLIPRAWPVLCSLALAAMLHHPPTLAAPAACSRSIVVASSPVGRAMTIGAGDTVQGAVRDFLDLVSQRTGCTFIYQAVPRARAWMLIEAGRADIMPAAAHSPQRDQYAQFVPTHQVRPMLITLDASLAAPADTTQLLETGWHIGVVRSYEFGPAYRSLLAGLAQRNRLHQVADPPALARLLRGGQIQAALLPPAAFADAGESSQLAAQLIMRELADLPHVRIGFYLSTRALPASDRSVLQAAISQAVASQAYAAAMRRHYPPWSLRGIRAN